MRKSILGIFAAVALSICLPAPSSQAWSHGGGGWHGGGGGWHGGGGGWHGGGWHGGTSVVVGIGGFAPWWGPGWYGAGYYGYGYGYGYPYYYPPYYYPPAVAAPPAYVQAPTPLPSGYWYWCPSANGYYPTVPSCDQPWVPVAPQPQQ